MRFAAWVRRHLNSWDEVCGDESIRLRMNTILFTLAVFFLFAIMAAIDGIMGGSGVPVIPLALMLVGLAVCLVQFFTPRYLVGAATVFGAEALFMSFYFLYAGGLGGFNFVWVYLVPHIAVMVYPLRLNIIFNTVLLAMVTAMLCTPLHLRLAFTYSPFFRFTFPASLLIVTLCVYLAEMVRHRAQKQLQTTAAKLESFAFTDPLTGAYNRHALVSHFGDYDNPAHGLSFAIMDLDFFKAVNDRHGHEAGDQMLRHVVQLIAGVIPPNALLYRWGGEEFLLVLKTPEAGDVALVLEKIRRAVHHSPLEYGQQAILVTISIGGACAAPGEDLRACIALADERLYAAKSGGRNRVVMR